MHHLRLLRPPRIRRRPLVSEKAMMAGQYRVGQVVVHLGWGDLDLVSSLGWWAATVATYCPCRLLEYRKPKTTTQVHNHLTNPVRSLARERQAASDRTERRRPAAFGLD